MISSLWNLDRIDLWKQYGSGYKDSKTIGNYKVEFDDEEDTLRMFIWNKERPCVVIALSRSLKIAVLDGVYYSPDCTIDGKMKKGEGTINMVKFALKIMKESGAKQVELTDKSTIQCNGIKIKLGLYYFYKYGQTWYEKHFGFQPLKYKKEYENAKKIQKTLGLENQPCTYFTDDILYQLGLKTGFTFLNDIPWVKYL
jgi:hypothetical protein